MIYDTQPWMILDLVEYVLYILYKYQLGFLYYPTTTTKSYPLNIKYTSHQADATDSKKKKNDFNWSNKMELYLEQTKYFENNSKWWLLIQFDRVRKKDAKWG